MTVTHRGEDENKLCLIHADFRTGSTVAREAAVDYSLLVLPIDKMVDLDTRIFDKAAKNTQ